MSDEKKVIAELKKVIFNNDETHWGVFKFFSDEKKKEFTGLGVIYPVVIGAIYELTGHGVYSKEYEAWQLKFSKSTHTEDLSARGIINFLAREGPNIGEERAKKIVSIFGEDTINILQDKPEELADKVSGFTLERAKKVSEWVKQEKKLWKVKEVLHALELTSWQIGKIIGKFGHATAEKLKTDCFSLTELDGIGYLTCCTIADRVGIAKTDPARIKSGVEYAIQEALKNGHMCMGHEDLIRSACKLTKVHKNVVTLHIKEMIDDGKLCTEKSDPVRFSTHPALFKQLTPVKKEN